MALIRNGREYPKALKKAVLRAVKNHNQIVKSLKILILVKAL